MLEENFGHSPIKKMFDQGDVYGVSYDEERAAKKMVRLGIIGAGGVTVSKYLPAIKRLQTIWEPVEVVAFARRSEQYGKHIEKVWNVPWYRDWENMLGKEDFDGVMILGPNDFHAEHALACLEKGLPILVEKPFTLSLTDGYRVCSLADEKGIPVMTVANKRYSPPYRRAKRFLDEGIISNPAMYSGKFNLGYDYVVHTFEAGTIHLFDLTRYFMGDIASISTIGVNRYRKDTSAYPFDNAMLNIRFVSGAIGQIYTSSTALSLKPWERIEIYGKNSWLTVEDQYELILYDSEQGPTKSWKPVVPNTLLFDEEFGGFMGLIENFLNVIRKTEKPIVTGWDGYYAYEMNIGALLSLNQVTPISFPLDPETADKERAKMVKY